MADGEDLDRPSAPETAAHSTASPLPGRRRLSVHSALGSGAVADLLLWRRRSATVLAVAGATAVWFLFERAGYIFLSVVSNALLLLVTILFFWAKSATLLNRPLPPLPNLEVSMEVVGKAADKAQVWINRVLTIGHDITIKRDRKVFLQVVLVLWLVSYIGSFCNFLTFIYIGVLLSLTIPALYDKYQDIADEKLNVLLKLYDNMLAGSRRQSTKQKKFQ